MPSIKEKLEKSKSLLKNLQNWRIFVVISSFLLMVLFFGSCQLADLFRTQNVFNVRVTEAAFATNLSGKEGSYVASKNGGAYYFPWCGIAGRIKDENKVWFASRAAAEKAGYKPSTNCHGLN